MCVCACVYFNIFIFLCLSLSPHISVSPLSLFLSLSFSLYLSFSLSPIYIYIYMYIYICVHPCISLRASVSKWTHLFSRLLSHLTLWQYAFANTSPHRQIKIWAPCHSKRGWHEKTFCSVQSQLHLPIKNKPSAWLRACILSMFIYNISE